MQIEIHQKKLEQQKGHIGNAKDFISGIQKDPGFDLNFVNLYREMQPFPTRNVVQRTNSVIFHNQLKTKDLKEQYK